MEKILDNLYTGSDEDFLRNLDKEKFRFLRCCKEGPGGHRDVCGYRSQGAPKGGSYLRHSFKNGMALNFIDAADPNLIPVPMVAEGIKYIDEQIKHGRDVMVACNAGHSRGPTTAMLYMRGIGELPGNFVSSERIYRTLCSAYEPSIGMRQFARTHWNHFDNLLRE